MRPVWCGLSASGLCRSCISWDRVEGAAKAKSSGTASSWATLVKRVFEVDPLQCPQCGSRMKVVSFIERCSETLWKRSSVIVVCGRARCERWPRPGLHPTQRTRIETHLSRINSSWSSIQSSFSEHLSRPPTGVGLMGARPAYRSGGGNSRIAKSRGLFS